jgi:hypothetical protein
LDGPRWPIVDQATDVVDPLDTASRVLFGHTDEMQVPHYAWLEDTWDARIKHEIARSYRHSRLATEVLAGTDHLDMVTPAMQAYLRCIREAACPEPPTPR